VPAVLSASVGPGGRGLALGSPERVAGGDRGGTRGRDTAAEGWQAVHPGHRGRTEIPGEVGNRGHPGVHTINKKTKQ